MFVETRSVDTHSFSHPSFIDDGSVIDGYASSEPGKIDKCYEYLQQMRELLEKPSFLDDGRVKESVSADDARKKNKGSEYLRQMKELLENLEDALVIL